MTLDKDSLQERSGKGAPGAGAPGGGGEPGAGGGGSGTPGGEAAARPALTRNTLELVRERNPRALSMLFEFYFERIYGLAIRLLGDRDAAQDVTQDVFRKVYKAAGQLDPERDPGPWLMAITHNTCRDLWRSRGYKLSRRSTPIDELAGAAVLREKGDTPEEAVARAERAQRVQAAIQQLPEPYRSVVLLHDYRGLSHEEIAVAVGATYAAVRKRYSRALAKLGELLKDIL